MNQKNVVFFLSKVENNKYPEAETWHPESITGRSYIVGYMRISDDPLAQPPGGNLGPLWGGGGGGGGAFLAHFAPPPPPPFLPFLNLILQEFCGFPETWDVIWDS